MAGIDWLPALPVCGKHIVTSGEASANAAAITTGKPTATVCIVQIMRAGADVTTDAAIALSAGVLTVGDGGSTYNISQNDVIMWMVA